MQQVRDHRDGLADRPPLRAEQPDGASQEVAHVHVRRGPPRRGDASESRCSRRWPSRARAPCQRRGWPSRTVPVQAHLQRPPGPHLPTPLMRRQRYWRDRRQRPQIRLAAGPVRGVHATGARRAAPAGGSPDPRRLLAGEVRPAARPLARRSPCRWRSQAAGSRTMMATAAPRAPRHQPIADEDPFDRRAGRSADHSATLTGARAGW